MNYKIIQDEVKFKEFINWLPELKENECFYLCLFARNKYVRDTPEYFAHIKSDKAQIKRFIVNRKQDIYNKVKQLEVEIGAYTTKDNLPVPQQALALYITVNPRNQLKAARLMLEISADLIIKSNTGFNIATEALSAIQKSIGTKHYYDVDIDLKDKSEIKFVIDEIYDYVNKDAITLIETRGGLHALIELSKIKEQHVKSWYNKIKHISGVDIQGDNMIPVIGCTQGGFTPKFI
jgi:hypothetical protein